MGQKYIKLLEDLGKPLMYFTGWFSIIGIILISIHDLKTGFILFQDIIEVLVIGYGIYVIVTIFFYFINFKIKE